METQTLRPPNQSSPTSSKSTFKKILVALDGSENSYRASQVALELADKLKADLLVVHAIIPPALYYHTEISSEGPVIEPPTHEKEIDVYLEYARRVAQGIVEGTVSEAKKHGITVKADIPEAATSVVETIVSHAVKENADLIVVGTRGLGEFKRLLLGSVSRGVIDHAHCPVLVIR
jgi:nucleotide-binding universal stress UspA family protein